MTGLHRRRVLGAVALVTVMLASDAWARTSDVLPYPFEQIWPTAIRFLRVDRGAAVKEKDIDSGYVLFELPEGGRTYKGSLELVRTQDGDGRDATRVVITLPDLPRHFETTLVDKLGIKAKDDNGAPAPPRPRKPPESPNDPHKGAADAGTPSGDLPRLDSR